MKLKKNLVLLLVFILFKTAVSQNHYLSFNAGGLSNTFDSIRVHNLDLCMHLTLMGNDTLHLTGSVGNNLNDYIRQPLKVFPNPFYNYAQVLFYTTNTELTHIEIFNVNGQKLGENISLLERGGHLFNISGLSTGVYMIKVSNDAYTDMQKMIVFGNNTVNNPTISYEGQHNLFENHQTKNAKNTIQMSYNSGDKLLFKAYSGNYPVVLHTLVPFQDETLNFIFTDSFIAGYLVACQSDTATYYETPYVDGAVYNWVSTAVGFNILGGQNSNMLTLGFDTTAVGGILEVSLTFDCNIVIQEFINIDVIQKPLKIDTIIGELNPCAGTSKTYSVNGIAGEHYFWSLPAGWVQTGGDSTHTITVTVGQTSGNIAVIPKNSCNYGAQTALAVIPQVVPLQPAVISGNIQVCFGDTVMYAVNNVNGVIYNWTFPADWALFSGGTTHEVSLIVGAQSGTISVISENACGTGPMRSLSVYSLEPPVADNNSPICSCDTLYLTASNISGASYLWTGLNGFTSTEQNPVVSTCGVVKFINDTSYWTVPTGVTAIEILLVGGGGGGGTGGTASRGGGGAGGVVYMEQYPVTPDSTYTVVVGKGGLTGATSEASANGGHTIFGELVALGGGGAGPHDAVGQAGGSGGGGSGLNNRAGGQGLQSASLSGGFGHDGGEARSGTTNGSSGGGGGAGAQGAKGNASSGGNGGQGLEFPQFAAYGGSPAGWFAGGGGGGASTTVTNAGNGGNGGGGNGAKNATAQSGILNTGGGGGGSAATGGNGASGIVIIKYSNISAGEYEVAAIVNGCTTATAKTDVVFDAILNTPTQGIITTADNYIVWNWQTVNGATGYKYNTTNDFNTANDNGLSTTFTQTSLNCNTLYTLYIWAYSDCSISGVLISTAVTDACSGFVCGTTVVYDADNNVYNTIQIGTQCWLKENLNIGTRINTSVNQSNNGTVEKYCYDNLETNCNTHGGLYQWDEAMQYATAEGAQGICPNGWHIPTDNEWTTLENFFPSGTAGTALKSGGSSGFDALMSGRRDLDGSTWQIGMGAYFWSSSLNANNAWYRFIEVSSTDVLRHSIAKSYGLSVRCIKN